MYSHYMDEETEAQRQIQHLLRCTARSGLSPGLSVWGGPPSVSHTDSTFWGSFGSQAPLSLRHLSLWYLLNSEEELWAQ